MYPHQDLQTYQYHTIRSKVTDRIAVLVATLARCLEPAYTDWCIWTLRKFFPVQSEHQPGNVLRGWQVALARKQGRTHSQPGVDGDAVDRRMFVPPGGSTVNNQWRHVWQSLHSSHRPNRVHHTILVLVRDPVISSTASKSSIIMDKSVSQWESRAT